MLTGWARTLRLADWPAPNESVCHVARHGLRRAVCAFHRSDAEVDLDLADSGRKSGRSDHARGEAAESGQPIPQDYRREAFLQATGSPIPAKSGCDFRFLDISSHISVCGKANIGLNCTTIADAASALEREVT